MFNIGIVSGKGEFINRIRNELISNTEKNKMCKFVFAWFWFYVSVFLWAFVTMCNVFAKKINLFLKQRYQDFIIFRRK